VIEWTGMVPHGNVALSHVFKLIGLSNGDNARTKVQKNKLTHTVYTDRRASASNATTAHPVR